MVTCKSLLEYIVLYIYKYIVFATADSRLTWLLISMLRLLFHYAIRLYNLDPLTFHLCMIKQEFAGLFTFVVFLLENIDSGCS